MTILVVDNDPDRLWKLVENIRIAFPNATVEYTHDPLFAGKFGFTHSVDILFTEVYMRRMDGLELAAMIRNKNPSMKSYLIAGEDELEECIILEDYMVSGCLVRPVSVEVLHKMCS